MYPGMICRVFYFDIMGIYDNHIHIILDGKNYKKSIARHENGIDEDYIRRVFEGYKLRGIKYLRDGGDHMGVSIRAKAIAPEYGISYLSPDFAIHKEGYYGDILGKSFHDEESLENLVSEIKAGGADFVKFMASGIMDFSDFGRFEGGMLTAEEIKKYMKVISSSGLPVMVHVNSAESVRAAVEAGAGSIEHGFFTDKDTLHVLRDYDCVWVPTVCAVGNLVNNPDMRGASREVLESIVKMQIRNVEYAMNIGCKIALGTDAGSYGVTHEEGILNEENFLMECSWDYESIVDAGNKYLWKRFGGNL